MSYFSTLEMISTGKGSFKVNSMRIYQFDGAWVVVKVREVVTASHNMDIIHYRMVYVVYMTCMFWTDLVVDNVDKVFAPSVSSLQHHRTKRRKWWRLSTGWYHPWTPLWSQTRSIAFPSHSSQDLDRPRCSCRAVSSWWSIRTSRWNRSLYKPWYPDRTHGKVCNNYRNRLLRWRTLLDSIAQLQ